MTPLPEDGDQEVAGVVLAGRRVLDEDGRPVAWRTDDLHDAATWSAFADAFPHTGLWPLLLVHGEGVDDPFEALTAPGAPADLAERDAEAVLRRLWSQAVDPDDHGHLEPFGPEFPGLASSPEPGRWQVGALVGEEVPAPMVLVPVAHPADVLAALRWSGATNHTNDGWELSVVLRSWAERFDALPVGLGFDSLLVFAGRPAVGDAALAVAAEHHAFCPDAIEQDGPGDLRGYAERLDGAVAWSFWWD